MTYTSTFAVKASLVLFVVTAGSILFATSVYAQKASYGQQIAVMKALRPDLKSVGVLGSALSDKATQDLTRAGLQQGVTVIIAKAKDPREVVSLYKKLVSEKKITMLWLPESSDEIIMGVSLDYLKENTVLDKVGLFVPDKAQLASGSLCSVQVENSKLTVYVNRKIAAVVGVTVPGEDSGINFVSQ